MREMRRWAAPASVADWKRLRCSTDSPRSSGAFFKYLVMYSVMRFPGGGLLSKKAAKHEFQEVMSMLESLSISSRSRFASADGPGPGGLVLMVVRYPCAVTTCWGESSAASEVPKDSKLASATEARTVVRLMRTRRER